MTAPAVHRVSVLLVFIAAGILMSTSPAHALSCISPAAVYERADSVYTGKIVGAIDGRLTIRVGEIWKGDQVPPDQSLRVDLVGWSEWSGPDGKIPDGYRSPATWVFAPQDADGDQVVSLCSAWRLREPTVQALRPASVSTPDLDSPVPEHTPNPSAAATRADASHGPTNSEEEGPNLGVRVGFPALVAAVTAGAVVLVRRRRG